MARISLTALALAIVTFPTIVESSGETSPPAMILVDDTVDDGSPNPPYEPTPTATPSGGSSSGTSPAPSPGDPQDDEGTADSGTGGMFGLPVAAQAGLSLAVILLAALALLPGRRPPAGLRA
ncbi:hypothetical protein [Stackebrandtia albiflava]|uniref:hypothetical protein n=1 Tax=Stackebrandtia albiflava TaxID=406432 RepID=UPI0011BEF0F2|nr:hypothetical protein [Stackebrandtia albiflava]